MPKPEEEYYDEFEVEGEDLDLPDSDADVAESESEGEMDDGLAEYYAELGLKNKKKEETTGEPVYKKEAKDSKKR